MEHSLGWVAQCKESVEALQSDTKQATFHRARCCQVLAAALAAQLALEHAVHKEGLTSHQSQALQQLCASTFAGIELAQQCIQDAIAQSGIISYATLRRKMPIEQMFGEVIEQLNGLAQQAWELQREADTQTKQCRQGMYELLERGLTPQSARRAGDALALVCMELVSGRRQGGLLPPGLASMQPGDAMQPHQALETLDTVRSLLNADSAELPHRAASSEMTSPGLSGSQPPGQTGSFDSASSQEKRWQEAAGFKAQQEPHAGTVNRAPPPPTHDEHAVSELSQSVMSQEVLRSASSSLSAQPSEPGDTENFLRRLADLAAVYSQQGALQQGSPRQDSPRFKSTPFDIARRHTSHEQSPHAQQLVRPRRSSADEQRLSDWTGHQMGQFGKDIAGRPLSSFTSSELDVLQAHDRGKQGQGQGSTSMLNHNPPHAASQQSSAELARPPGTSESPSREDDRRSSRGSSVEVFESLNCPIVDYSQLQIKRKIGDGSIGLVYLGKWQETDVAVKVLIEKQDLAPDNEVQPQDPATLEPWTGSADDNHPQQGGEKRKTANGLIGLTDAGVSASGELTLAVSCDPESVREKTQAIKTLEREVSIMASLRHPNVVMFMGMCVEPPCIITEFCARGSLFDVLRKARTSPAFAQQLDWSKRLSMALDAAKGVLHLHSHKPTILHRDLKSPNMLVERHWRVKVTDFNLSRMVQTAGTASSIHSLLANNPRWLAPEVVADHNYSKAADVYSFGIIMWEMMTWDMPWEDLNAFQIMLRLQAQDRPEIPELDALPGQPLPGIAEYIKLMKECWSQDASSRPGFQHVIVSIRGLLEGATNKQKMQKTLTEVPKLSTTSMVPPNLNKLPVVGQTPHRAAGSEPQQTPTPLHSQDKQVPLQIYETDRPFFGSAPVGGLDILTSQGSQTADKALENVQYNPLSGAGSQQELRKLEVKNSKITRRNSYNGTSTPMEDLLGTGPSLPHRRRPKQRDKTGQCGPSEQC